MLDIQPFAPNGWVCSRGREGIRYKVSIRVNGNYKGKMKILEQEEIKLDWVDLNKLVYHPFPDQHRTKGIHVTDILRKIAIDTKQLTLRDLDDEFAPIRVFLGVCWEMGCVRLYKDIEWQPGEVVRDGIIGSPDGVSVIKGELCIEEFKYTNKSIRVPGGDKNSLRDIVKEWLWRNQILAYMALHPDQPRLARWHVCWAMGNYTFPYEERYVRYLVRAEDREVEGCWAMLKKWKLKV